MPGVTTGFHLVAQDQQVADVVNFIRTGWGNNAPGKVKVEDVAKMRKETDPASDQAIILRMR